MRSLRRYSPAGRLIGPYKIIRKIGHGGMGSVFLAARADDQYRKQVAIKLVKRGMDTDFIVSRFLSERQILASLDHPNIASLFDGGATADGLPYFVMEDIEGLPINEYCDTHNLSTTERLKLFSIVCAAVHYAHRKHIIHRDIKPTNILVTADGMPKLLDFGIAKILDPDLSIQTTGRTATARRLMTPGYASPEQVRGESVTTASDIYSLGVLLYELLTGHRPYHVRNRATDEIARVICEQEPEKPSTAITRIEEVHGDDGLRPIRLTPESVSKTRDGSPEKLRRRLAGDIDNIVLMAIRKEPRRRYESVEQFSEDIRRHLEGRPVRARKDTLSYRSAKFINRNRAAVIEVALSMLVVGLLIVLFYFWFSRKVSEPEVVAERSIAVLPFKPVSAEGGDEYIGLGMADALINKLRAGCKINFSDSDARRWHKPTALELHESKLSFPHASVAS